MTPIGQQNQPRQLKLLGLPEKYAAFKKKIRLGGLGMVKPCSVSDAAFLGGWVSYLS